MSINSLTRAIGPVLATDLVAGWPAAEQDDRVFTMAQILAYIQANASNNQAFFQQFASPSANNFNVAITQNLLTPFTWLILQPTGTFALGTITLPAFPVDGQRVRCNCTQIVTALTVAGNGRTVTGAPTTLAANGFFEMCFSTTLNTWFRVG